MEILEKLKGLNLSIGNCLHILDQNGAECPESQEYAIVIKALLIWFFSLGLKCLHFNLTYLGLHISHLLYGIQLTTYKILSIFSFTEELENPNTEPPPNSK